MTAQPLAGRVAIVTGGSRGIGKGIAEELGAAGATVYVTGRSRSEGEGPVMYGSPLPGTVYATAESVSALGWEHINLTGDYRWQPNGKRRPGKYRPLRSVTAARVERTA